METAADGERRINLALPLSAIAFFPLPPPSFTVDAKLDHSAINPVRAGAEAAEVSSATRPAQRALLAMD